MTLSNTLAGSIILLAVGISTAAIAQTPECDNILIDNAHIIPDPGRVEAAARQLGNAGATVRVRTIGNTVPTSSLDDYVKAWRNRCSTWRYDDQWRSTMIVFAFAPRIGNQVGLYYGPGEAGKLGGGKWQDVLRTNFVPQLQAYDHGNKTALTEGFVNSLTELTALVSRPSTGGNVVINQAADHSKGWRFMYWVLGVLVIFGAVAIFWWWLAARAARRSAQAEARRVRSECVTGILEITDDTDHVVLQSGIDTQPDDKHEALNRKMVQYKNYGDKALGSFSRFDSMSGRDPLEADMPVEGYRNLQARYEDIVDSYVNPARRLRLEIEAGDVSMPSPNFRRETTTQGFGAGTVGLGGGGGVLYQGPFTRQQPTVIVQGGSGSDGFVTGMFLGDAMARASDAEAELRAERRRRDADYIPSEHVPPPASGNGGSYRDNPPPSTPSPPSDNGGSFSVDTSSPSDTGGSFSSGC